MNLAAFAWGRRAAIEPEEVMRQAIPSKEVLVQMPRSVNAILEDRVAYLSQYQDASYARAYQEFVARVRTAEQAAGLGDKLTKEVAKNLFKLMAYKDEYEVARLHTDTAFLDRVNGMFEGDFKLNYHLAPPIIAKKNAKGELQKRKFGPAMLTGFRFLARLKGLRGTALDIFGRTEERRMERGLIAEYEAGLDKLLPGLDADRTFINL